jgi:hypothetical protein
VLSNPRYQNFRESVAETVEYKLTQLII